jgi:hypothetical protein
MGEGGYAVDEGDGFMSSLLLRKAGVWLSIHSHLLCLWEC